MAEEQLSELIVEFERGVSEATARRLVEAAGATVRRKMRTDASDQVMLLVRVSSEDVDALETTLAGEEDVVRTERNEGGFHVAG